jgi:2-polyprenyl-3-methyl-5-hydroxy-6-metoxy-1,4-benzoquinol methylase
MDNITIDIYNKNAAKYANLDIDKVSLKAYREFSSLLPKNGIVLDYGCGPGYFSKKFLADGFQVNAFDASEKMIEIASMETRVNWWVGDFKSFAPLLYMMEFGLIFPFYMPQKKKYFN